jgi:hypothetical protein
VSDSQRRWARRGFALPAALVAASAAAGPLDRGGIPDPAAAPPPPTAAPSSPERADLALVWVDVLGSARTAFPEAAREIVSLLERMGVRATLREGDAHSVSSASELTLVILPRRSPGAGLDQSVMGATHRTPQGVRAIWVYAAGVGATLGLDLTHGHLSLPERRDFGTALGRVVVHELVHALAPDRPHVKGGLMAGRMGRPLLLSAHLAIDAATAEAFRHALAGRAAPGDAVATAPAPEPAGEEAEARP